MEQATAAALVARESRRAVERSLREATDGLADALRRLVSQDVSIERAAALLELDATEVRRPTKLASGEMSLARTPITSLTAPPDTD